MLRVSRLCATAARAKALRENLGICGGRRGKPVASSYMAFLDYGKSGELYDMEKDPKQYVNLIDNPAYAETLATMKAKLKAKLTEISKNDLGGK